MNETIIKICALWLIYGFLGFIVETVYCSVGEGKFVQRGFLTGPIIPIYAFGALIILYFLKGFHSPYVVFILGVILTSALEYIGSFIMEKLFHLKLWDYSTYPLNLNGRICLKNSLLFGILSVLLVFVINPDILKLLNWMNVKVLNITTIILMGITIFDTASSVLVAMNVKSQLQKLATIKENINEEQIKALVIKQADKYRYLKQRLFDAYPDMTSEKLSKALEEFKKHYLED